MIKRLFDLIASIAALITLSTVMALVAWKVRRELGSPVLFRQTRPGRNGVAFQIVKFRTMLDTHDKQGQLLSDAERLTPFGRFLRASSLDELPELWNVLNGDMSLVGPRPLLMEYLSLYDQEQRRRHHLRPGITGWAQIHGRNAISWPDKFKLDVWYVDNRTFWLDLKIIVLTIKKVLMRDGINAAGEATMRRFTGSSDTSQN
jgi:lipopolysaccharide/colanic/teichoic acid biosynthesis glycosyltransferase